MWSAKRYAEQQQGVPILDRSEWDDSINNNDKQMKENILCALPMTTTTVDGRRIGMVIINNEMFLS